MSDFKKINFGLMDAESEKAYSPKLLLEGFFDESGYIDQILKKEKKYIFGAKGSGKSAIGSRIELLAKDNPRLFVNQYILGRFEYKKFSELFPGSESPESRYPMHWEFILLIALLNNLKRDTDCQYESSDDFYSLITTLKEIEVIPDKEFTDIVKKTYKGHFNLGIFGGEVSSESTKHEISITTLFNQLRSVCYSVKTPHEHVLIIDGLDIVLTHREKQYKALSALLTAVNELNIKLKENSINAKIVVLCRTDLLNKMSDPNSNKFIQNFGIFLNWYQETDELERINLIKLINLRVKLSLKKDIDISTFFPATFEGNKETMRTFIEHTRHLPRDFIQLLNKIQESTLHDVPSKNDIKTGIHSYSENYFVREIHNTMSGFLDGNEDMADRIIQLLTSTGKTTFSYEEIEKIKKSDPRFSNINLIKTLELLFDMSAIGNINPSTKYVTFKYRNVHSTFYPTQLISVHKGLHKGLNLRYENL